MTAAAALWVFGFYAAVIGAFWLSIKRGRGPERLAAAVFCGATILSILARFHARAFADVELPLALIDLWVLATIWLISLFANRWWPMIAFGALLVSSAAHLVKALDPSLAPSVYARIESMSSWPTLLALCLPMIRRSKRHDATPTWHRSLPPAARRMLTRLRLD